MSKGACRRARAPFGGREQVGEIGPYRRGVQLLWDGIGHDLNLDRRKRVGESHSSPLPHPRD